MSIKFRRDRPILHTCLCCLITSSAARILTTSDMNRLVLLGLLCALVATTAVSAFDNKEDFSEQELREIQEALELRGWWADLKAKAAAGWTKLKGAVGGLASRIMNKGKAFAKKLMPMLTEQVKSCAAKVSY